MRVDLNLYIHLDDSIEDYIEMVLELMAVFENEVLVDV